MLLRRAGAFGCQKHDHPRSNAEPSPQRSVPRWLSITSAPAACRSGHEQLRCWRPLRECSLRHPASAFSVAMTIWRVKCNWRHR